MSEMFSAHREGRGRLVQPHGVLRVRRRVLLAVHEGGLRSALPEVKIVAKVVYINVVLCGLGFCRRFKTGYLFILC